MSTNSYRNKIGSFTTVLQSVESTNNYAMGKVHAGLARHGELWMAMEQTAGKGQRGRRWETEPGANIILSIALEPHAATVSQPYLNMAIALGCYDFFFAYAGEHTSLKWPNDLYWRDRKAGGILIENIIQGERWLYAIAGIGINLNQTVFDEALQHAVSLKQITGKTSDLTDMTAKLCDCLEVRYEQFLSDSAGILKTYQEVLYKLGQPVKLRKGNILFETTIKGVDKEGALITSDVMERRFNWGEVEWVSS